jgi:hypothetical protein
VSYLSWGGVETLEVDLVLPPKTKLSNDSLENGGTGFAIGGLV